MSVSNLAVKTAYATGNRVTEAANDINEPLLKGERPSAENSRDYRDALGRFGTGVTIITATTENGPIGMTANSFSSVSLTPALVLWSLGKSAGRFEPFSNAHHYAIHVLFEDQQDMAMQFARQGDCFDQYGWNVGDNGVPLIDNTLARFECAQHSVHDAGDHIIIVGEVQRFYCETGAPLLYANGGFGSFEKND